MTTIAVIGLGYVGLPLAVEFGKKVKTVGFDLHQEKVDAYARHVDPTGEVSTADLKAAVHLTVRPGRVFGLEMLAVEERRRSRRVSTLDVWGTTWFGGSGLFELE